MTRKPPSERGHAKLRRSIRRHLHHPETGEQRMTLPEFGVFCLALINQNGAGEAHLSANYVRTICHLSKTTAWRLVKTLAGNGYLASLGEGRYKVNKPDLWGTEVKPPAFQDDTGSVSREYRGGTEVKPQPVPRRNPKRVSTSSESGKTKSIGGNSSDKPKKPRKTTSQGLLWDHYAVLYEKRTGQSPTKLPKSDRKTFPLLTQRVKERGLDESKVRMGRAFERYDETGEERWMSLPYILTTSVWDGLAIKPRKGAPDSPQGAAYAEWKSPDWTGE